jgi:3D (Asp-Asp-Asp) domain-containing protein
MSVPPGVVLAQNVHHPAAAHTLRAQGRGRRLPFRYLVQYQSAASSPLAQTIDGHPIVQTLHLTATAYGPSLQDNYPYGAVDYFGRPLVRGDIAVDPSVIPLGTLLWVTGYSSPVLPSGGFLARAVDTGDAIQGNHIDIYIDAAGSVVSNFGIQGVTAFVLK